jgi:hypothetical protein
VPHREQRKRNSVSGTSPRPDSTSSEVGIGLVAARIAEHQHADIAGAQRGPRCPQAVVVAAPVPRSSGHRFAGLERDRRRRLFRATAIRLPAAVCQSGRSQTGSGARLPQAPGGCISRQRQAQRWPRRHTTIRCITLGRIVCAGLKLRPGMVFLNSGRGNRAADFSFSFRRDRSGGSEERDPRKSPLRSGEQATATYRNGCGMPLHSTVGC